MYQHHRHVTIGFCGALTLLAATACADPVARVSDLAWMTGSWSGPVGDMTLEENWVRPVGGSIASLVRQAGNGETRMVELIVVEEEADTLVLRIQQFDPGFAPRTTVPQVLALTHIGDRTVTFESASAGGLKKLTYARPADDRFTVAVELTEGDRFDIEMTPIR